MLVVNADPEALEQILLNLIENAFVHGWGTVEVEVADEGDSGAALGARPRRGRRARGRRDASSHRSPAAARRRRGDRASGSTW